MAKMGVYSVLRGELWGQAAERFKRSSYVHGEGSMTAAKIKI
jgi:Delta3-Delta2-enoyl-CoA isomerase